MLTLISDQVVSIPDLAASLTDRALEFLGGRESRRDTVAMELELWHAFTAELKREVRVRRVIPQHDALWHGAHTQVAR